MKTFSLRTLFVVVAFVSLLLSLAMTGIRLRDANRELEIVRRNYGYMKIRDPSKVNVIALAQERDAFRFVVPPGERYFLHLSETTAQVDSVLPSGKHKTTVALNSWKDGEDVILKFGLFIDPEKDAPYLEVRSLSENFFTYRPDDWPSGAYLDPVFQIEAVQQREYSRLEPIVLLRATCKDNDRGILLWLEPESHRIRSVTK